MDSKIRVLLVGYLPLELGGKEIGGIASIMPEWAEALSKFPDLDVYLTAPCRHNYDEVREFSVHDGYAIFYQRREIRFLLAKHGILRFVVIALLKLFEKFGFPHIRNWKMNLYWQEMQRIINTTNPDVINIHTFFEEAQSIAAINGGRAKIINSVHGIQLNEKSIEELDDKHKHYYLGLMKKIFTDADAIAFSSNYNLEYARQLNVVPPEKVQEVVCDGVNTDYFIPMSKREARAAVGLSHYENVVLFVGGLVRRKSAHLLIEAFSNMNHEMLLKSVLVIIGDGPEKPRLEELGVELKTQNRIMFVGGVSEKRQLRSWYNSSDLYVLPSSSEGLAISVLEAMSCCVPVISCRPLVGFYENLQHGVTCRLVDYGDVRGITEAMEIMITDRTYADSLAGNARIVMKEHFTWPVRASQMHERIERTVRGEK